MHNPDHVYTSHVTELGESREVVATEDIHNQQGAKLINKGARIDRQVFERLVRHKLIKPLDTTVQVEDGVTAGTLVKEARQLIERESGIGALLEPLRDRELPVQALGRIELDPAFAVKLTVARERLPELYTHSVRVAVCAAAVGGALGLNHHDLGALATAGVFHDLGELHIDPVIFDRGHTLTDEERQHLYAHPAIACAMLQLFPTYPARIERAVLEHHERLDGSGYPHGLVGDAISPLGRLLAFAELIAGTCERRSCGYLEVILRFQAEKYGTDLVNPVAAAMRVTAFGERPTPTLGKPALSTLLTALDSCLDTWRQTAKSLPGGATSAGPAGIVAARLNTLTHAFARTGLPLQDIASILNLLDEGSHELGEMEILVRESLFQFREIGHELRRRWPDLENATDPAAAKTVKWIQQARDMVATAMQKTNAPPAPASACASAAA